MKILDGLFHSYSKYKVRSFVVRIILIAIISLMFCSGVPAQDSISMVSEPKHSARKATLYSLALPGLGQAYNKKYWKIPIIYAGVGTLTYFAVSHSQNYQKSKEAYIYVSTAQTYPINNDYVGRYDATQLRSMRDYYRRNLEFTYILGGLLYILNIVDATVDAHFYNFDISDNLSLRLGPVSGETPGMGIVLSLGASKNKPAIISSLP